MQKSDSHLKIVVDIPHRHWNKSELKDAVETHDVTPIGHPFDNDQIRAVFDAFPKPLQGKLLQLRRWIYEVARSTEGCGQIIETLKWGQPSYLTVHPKSGSTVRIDQIRAGDGCYAMYCHCQTTLIDTYRRLYGGLFEFEGNRGIIFRAKKKIAVKPLKHCIALALTYHAHKQKIL